MRVPPVQKRRRSFGIRGWLIAAAILVVVLLLSARGLARVYTDYLWFQEVHFSQTWRGLIEAKAFPALIFSLIFFVAMYVDLVVADRLAPLARSAGPEDEIVERYRTVVAAVRRAGSASRSPRSSRRHGERRGVRVARLDPVLARHASSASRIRSSTGTSASTSSGCRSCEFIAGWTFAALLVILIVTLVFHYLNGGIRLQTPFQRVTPQVKVHISVILALMALTKTVQYYLARFGLTLSHRGVVDGATYTDVKAQLPALNLLMLISVAAAILFIANIFRKGWVFPIIAVGLWGFISIVVGTIYPAVIQRFVVQPNEYAREQTYIKRNINATRAAFGLDKIDDEAVRLQHRPRAPKTVAQPDNQDDARQRAALGSGRRCGKVLSPTEEFQPFYTFSDVDVDRYDVNGTRTQALSGVRELDSSQLPSNTWTNRHLVYTHGYGIDTATANAHNGDQPELPALRHPAEGPTLAAHAARRVLRRGAQRATPSSTARWPSRRPTARRSRRHDHRVPGRRWREGDEPRAAARVRAAVRRLQPRVLGPGHDRARASSTSATSRSGCRPRRRSCSGTPTRTRSNLDGKIVWVLDGYTTTNRYPYSQSINPTVPPASGLNTNINYVRNSVKATVDAYDGTIHFYVVDPSDPIIRTYEKAFPDLFDDVDEMPAGLRDHWRYPEDIFEVQTEQYTQYHMTDPQQFFQKAALWDVAPSPDVDVHPTGTAVDRGAGRRRQRRPELDARRRRTIRSTRCT